MATQREMYHGNELYAWRENAANRTRAIDVDKWAQNQADILHLPGAQGEKKLSILDNVISPSSAFVQVDTEGGAPADDLASITPGDLHSGMLLHLVAADSERVVTLRNSADATGIQTVDGKDVDLDTQYSIVLRLVSTDALTYWQEIPGPLRAKTQPATSKDSLGLMQVGQHLEVTPEGVVDAPVASESKQGIGRSATTAEVESGVTGENGPAWVTPENFWTALNSLFVGKIELLPFRSTNLPTGWYFCNGDRFPLSTPQGVALNGLPTEFKSDWGITISNNSISLPNLFYSDGRGYFLRSVDGLKRNVGSVQTDAIRNITGTFGGCLTRGGTGAFFDPGTAITDNYNGGPYLSNRTAFDPSRVVPTADENVVLNCGMTPAIFIGV